MDKITEQEFLYSQGPDKGKSNIRTERFYLNIANKSLQRLVDADALSWLHEQLLKPLALCLTGYYQDVIADGGAMAHIRRPMPFPIRKKHCLFMKSPMNM